MTTEFPTANSQKLLFTTNKFQPNAFQSAFRGDFSLSTFKQTSLSASLSSINHIGLNKNLDNSEDDDSEEEEEENNQVHNSKIIKQLERYKTIVAVKELVSPNHKGEMQNSGSIVRT